MKTYILTLFLFWWIFSVGQNEPTFNSEQKKAISSYNNKDYAGMKYHLDAAEKYIKGEDSLIQKAQLFNNYGAYYWKIGEYINSVDNYQISIDIYENMGEDSLKAETEYNMGLALKNAEIYDLAIGSLSSALLYYEKRNNQYKIFKVYSVMGNLFRKTGEYAQSADYQLMALELCNTLNDTSKVYHSLGMLYNESNKPEKAIFYLREAKKIKQDLGIVLASTNAQMGQYFLKQNQLDSAEIYFKESLVEREQIGVRSKLVPAYLHMGNLCIKLKEYVRADEYLGIAYSIADSLNYYGSLVDILEARIAVDKVLGRTVELLSNYELLIQAKEKVWGKDERTAKVKFEIEFKTLKQNQKIELMDTELEVKQLENKRLVYRNSILFGVIVFTFIIVGGMVWFTIVLRKSREEITNKNAQLNENNQLIESLHRELSHRTKNYYQMFAGLLKFDLKSTDDPKIQSLLKRYVRRVKAMSEIHRYLHSEKTISGTVKLDLYLSNLLQIMDVALNTNKVKIKEAFTTMEYNYDKALRLGLVVNEIVSNSLEHGFDTQTEGEIKLHLLEREDGLTLTIKDNGKGYYPDSLTEMDLTHGTRIIKNILSSVRGTIEYQNQSEGTVVFISIPN